MVRNPPHSAGDARDSGLIPRSGRFPGAGKWPPTPVFLPENSMGRGAWQATVWHSWVTEHMHTHTHTHLCFSGEPWLIQILVPRMVLQEKDFKATFLNSFWGFGIDSPIWLDLKMLMTLFLSQSVQAAIKEHHRLSGLQATEIYFSRFWSLGGSRSRYWHIQRLVRALIQLHKQKSSLFVLERVRELSWVSFIRVLLPFMGAPSSWTNDLPKVPPSNTITL